VFPLVFAALLDHGMPRAVFLLAAALCMLSILAVMIGKLPAEPVVARPLADIITVG
jgi:hypothetical protein